MKLQPLKYFCSEPAVYGLNLSADDYGASGVRILRTTDIGSDGVMAPGVSGVYVSADQVPPNLMLQDGDLLLSRSGTLGRSLLYKGGAAPTTHAGYLVRFRISADNHPPYVAYCARSNLLQDAVNADSVASTIGNFNAERYSKVQLPWWSISQQKAIARYLDHQTARIATLITAKEEAVALVQERFQSAIFHEITGGDTVGSEQKRSGLEWVESIPVDWTTPPVAANFEVQLGKMLNPAASAGLDQRPYLRNVNVQWDRFDLDDVATMHFGSNDQRIYALRAGDLLVCEGGEVGRAAIWQNELSECYFQKALHRLRLKKDADARYLLYCLWAAANHGVFAVEGNLSTIVHLTREQLMAHRFPWPPAGRQREIVARLDALGRSTRAAATRIKRQIELLQERRQALITAAVTGELEIPEGG